MNTKEQEIIESIRLRILKELVDDLEKFSSLEKKKINKKEIYLEEPPSYIIDAQVELLNKLKKEDSN